MTIQQEINYLLGLILKELEKSNETETEEK